MNLDTKNLPPEVAAYIQSLEEKNRQLEKQLVKMQSLNEQLVKMRKRMFGQSSEQIQYVDARQLDFFNEAEVCSDASAPEPGKTTPVKAHARKAKRTKEELTEGLEHKKVVCELPEQEQICAKCGSAISVFFPNLRCSSSATILLDWRVSTSCRAIKPACSSAVNPVARVSRSNFSLLISSFFLSCAHNGIICLRISASMGYVSDFAAFSWRFTSTRLRRLSSFVLLCG